MSSLGRRADVPPLYQGGADHDTVLPVAIEEFVERQAILGFSDKYGCGVTCGGCKGDGCVAS
jgi:hypothetical protein